MVNTSRTIAFVKSRLLQSLNTLLYTRLGNELLRTAVRMTSESLLLPIYYNHRSEDDMNTDTVYVVTYFGQVVLATSDVNTALLKLDNGPIYDTRVVKWVDGVAHTVIRHCSEAAYLT